MPARLSSMDDRAAPRIAVTGTTGRVGMALATHFESLGWRVTRLPRASMDLADSAGLKRALERLDCRVLLNPAALTSVDACERDPEAAYRVNGEAVATLARWADGRGVRLVHFSTDYVFSGETPGLRAESEPPAPAGAYARAKAAGEAAALSCADASVVRVSWVFGPEKPSFVDAVFDNALAGKPLAAVADKFSLPTHTADLARWIEALLGTEESGVFHACNPGEPASWHDLATATVAAMWQHGLLDAAPAVARQSLDDMAGFLAPRPRHTAMATGRLASLAAMRPWRDALVAHITARSGVP